MKRFFWIARVDTTALRRCSVFNSCDNFVPQTGTKRLVFLMPQAITAAYLDALRVFLVTLTAEPDRCSRYFANPVKSIRIEDMIDPMRKLMSP